MDEFALADINADMAEGAPHGVEKNQIAGLQFSAIDFCSGGGLLLGFAGKNQTHRLLVHGPDEAAAVKAGLCGVAATPVRHTEKTDGRNDQFRCFFADGVPYVVNPRQQTFVSQKLVHVIDRPGRTGLCTGSKQNGNEGGGDSHGGRILAGQACCQVKAIFKFVA